MKRKIKIKNVVLLVVILAFIAACVFIFLNGEKTFFEKPSNGYLASNTLSVDLYELKTGEDDTKTMEKSLDLVRGSKIEYFKDSKITIDEVEYTKVSYDSNTYYILSDNIVEKMEDVVLEKELYVRTSLNLLEDLDGNLLSLLEKGEKVEVIGFNELQDDGSVDLYKIKVGDEEGYYYSKYLVATEEESLKNYDEDGIYKIHL